MENKWQKTPFITADKLDQITAEFPTPFHLYDEKGIRETARAVNAAFSWNPGFKEFFAVKATPNQPITESWRKKGAGVGCATDTELVMSNKVGFVVLLLVLRLMIHEQKNLFTRVISMR